MKKLCLVFALGTAALFAADSGDQTLRMKNGRFWNSLPSEGEWRALFVAGLLDGWELRGYTQVQIPGKIIIAMSGTVHFTIGDLTNMVTSARRMGCSWLLCGAAW